MDCHILAVGQKMPTWCTLACAEYLKRLQRFLKCHVSEIPTAVRHKSGLVAHYQEEEGRKILQKVPAQDQVIALVIEGQSWSTVQLSKALAGWQLQGKNLSFLIGGPDGLSLSCLQRATTQVSLSALTFAHPLARVMLLEQLYRSATLLANHPYHRD